MVDDFLVQNLSKRILETPGFPELIERILNDEAAVIALQPRVEFLASIEKGKDTETSILEFFEETHLSEFDWEHNPKSNEFHVQADTYSVIVKLLPPSNSNIPEAEVLLIIIEAEELGELEVIRDLMLESDLSAQFRDFELVWDGCGAIRSWLSYISLHLLENQLRKHVMSRLMGIEDYRWWDKRIKGLSGGTYLVYKQRELAATDITHYPDDIAPDIFFTDLSALEKVIANNDNWKDVFQRVFVTSKYIQKIGFLNRLRRKIAHNRFLTERNQKDLNDLLTEFLRAFRRVEGS